MAQYELVSGGSVVPIRRPLSATWSQPTVGSYASGAARQSARAKVTWTFPRLREAELMVLVSHFPAAGTPITFRTFRPPVGAVPAQWVLCTGIMQPVEMGIERGGFYTGVSVSFARVQVV
jgi:hypothetical protein